MAKRTIKALDVEIRLTGKDGEDYLCLTDIAKTADQDTDDIIRNYLRNQSNLQFLGAWEKLHNPNFNPAGFDGIRLQATENSFVISVKKWVEATGAIGIESTPGRYGGTYAHSDIALEFATWVNPVFKLYVLKDYQRLKKAEQEAIRWSVKRELTKSFFPIHTEAVREHLVPVIDWNTKREAIYQASEADVLNLALFGVTAKQWRQTNPEAPGNIRDNASALQLLVLASLEVSNAELIEQGLGKEERIKKLNEKAQDRMTLLLDTAAGKKLIDKADPKRRLK